jgi:hypothetical protein
LATTGNIFNRQTGTDAGITHAVLQACRAACAACAQECEGCIGSSFIGLQLMERLGGFVLGHRPARVVRKAVTARPGQEMSFHSA